MDLGREKKPIQSLLWKQRQHKNSGSMLCNPSVCNRKPEYTNQKRNTCFSKKARRILPHSSLLLRLFQRSQCRPPSPEIHHGTVKAPAPTMQCATMDFTSQALRRGLNRKNPGRSSALLPSWDHRIPHFSVGSTSISTFMRLRGLWAKFSTYCRVLFSTLNTEWLQPQLQSECETLFGA